MAEISREVLEHCLSALSDSIVSDKRWLEDQDNIRSLGSILYGYALWLLIGDLETQMRDAAETPFEVFDDNTESRMFRGTIALTGRLDEIRIVIFNHLTDELHVNGQWCSDCLEEYYHAFLENNNQRQELYDLLRLGYSAHRLVDKTFSDAFFEVVDKVRSVADKPQPPTVGSDSYRGSRKGSAPIPDSESHQGNDKHVFLSYVREDAASVSNLATALRRAGIAVWMDRDSIEPGERWATAIRRAITAGAHFLACFSNNYMNRDSTYMDEELAIAISELRASPTEKSWIIPIRLSDVEIPALDVGGGNSLRDIQWIDLHTDWETGVLKLSQKVGAAKRQPPVSGNAFLLDTSTPMESRISNAVEYWLGHGRAADGLVNGKAFFALACWIYNRIGPYRKKEYTLTPETRDYLEACKVASGGDEGWDDILRDHIACESCRENYRFENISIDTRSMRYFCFRCAPYHEDVVG